MIARRAAWLAVCVVVLLGMSAASAQDVIVLQNGSTMSGRITEDTGDSIALVLENPAGTMRFRYEDCKYINGIDIEELTVLRRVVDATVGLALRAADIKFLETPQFKFCPAAQMTAKLQERFLAMNETEHPPHEGKLLSLMGVIPQDADPRSVLAQVLTLPVPARFLGGDENIVLVRSDEVASAPSVAGTPIPYVWVLTGLSEHALWAARAKCLAVQKGAIPVEGIPERLAGSYDTRIAVQAFENAIAQLLVLDGAFRLLQISSANCSTPEILFPALPAVMEKSVPDLSPFMVAREKFLWNGGFELVWTAKTAGGWRAVKKMAKLPPVSTEQLMHIEKYLTAPDYPIIVTLDLSGLGPEIKTLPQVTLGEQGIYEMLLPHMPQTAAAAGSEGWGGDAMTAIDNGDDTFTVAWFTTWDSGKDSAEFYKSLVTSIPGRHPDAKAGDATNDSSQWKTPQGLIKVERRGTDVVIIENAPAGSLDKIAEELWKSRKIPFIKPDTHIPLDGESFAAAKQKDALLRMFWSGKTQTGIREAGKLEGGLYANEKLGFGIALPKGWNLVEPKSGTASVLIRKNFDKAEASVRIRAGQLPIEISPLALLLMREGYTASAGYVPVSAEWQTVEANKFYVVTFGGDRVCRVAVAQKDKRYVVLELTTPPDAGAAAANEIHEMLGSFRPMWK